MPASKNLSNVNVGSVANSGEGDLLRDAFIKVNNNINGLYSGGQHLGYSNDSKLAPAFTFDGDRDTGMYHPAQGQIGFALNGAEGLTLNEDGTIKWFTKPLATQEYVTALLTNFTGGISAANISVSTGGGSANVTINGIPVVSSLPAVGNQSGRIVFYAGDVWIYSSYPVGNGIGLPADASIARAAGSDSRWVRFRSDTAFQVGLVKPQTAPEGTVFYETSNTKPYLFVSGQWRTLSSVVTSSAPSGLEVLLTVPLTNDPSNYSGRTIVVGNFAYIFTSGSWKLLSDYVGGSGSGQPPSSGTLPPTANAFELYRKTGTNAGLYIYNTGTWNTIQQYTANVGTARIKTVTSLPSDVSVYNPGDLIILSGITYILKEDKSSWAFFTPGGVGGTITGIGLNAGQVSNVELASNSVISGKIASNVILGLNLTPETITSREIANSSISSFKLAANAVTSGKIQSGSITDREIASNSISGSKITTGTIGRSQLAPNIFTGVSVSANTLSEISQNAGTITAGIFRSTDGRMIIDLNSKYIRIEL